MCYPGHEIYTSTPFPQGDMGHVFQTPTQLLWTLIRDKRPKPHALLGKSLSCPHTVSGERGSFTTPRVSQGQWKPNVSALHANLHRHIHTHTHTYMLCKYLLRVQVKGSFCSSSVNCRWVCRRQNLTTGYSVHCVLSSCYSWETLTMSPKCILQKSCLCMWPTKCCLHLRLRVFSTL